VGRPSFGVARPMRGSGMVPAQQQPVLQPQPDYMQPAGSGAQFPTLETADLSGNAIIPQTSMQEAMSRLSNRGNNAAPIDDGPQGFEASVYKIKEQVLPRLLERVDPEAAASLNKEELTEEFRPIILEVLAELKLTLNRREQFALEKVLVDELLGFGPLEELLRDPDITDIMVNGPLQTYIEKRVSCKSRRFSFAMKNICFGLHSGSSTKWVAASTRPRRLPLRA
jgi:pilus assembly protein CpaF